MARCARLAPALLLHINVLLAAYGGVALATAARLKWDASTYIAVRELFPGEYRAAAAVLCAGGGALLLLAHAALLALAARAPRHKRAALLAYACVMLAMAAGEAVFLAWVWRRAVEWLRSQRAAELLEALQLREHLRPLLDYVARWHPLPHQINRLIEVIMSTPRSDDRRTIQWILGDSTGDSSVGAAAGSRGAGRADRAARALRERHAGRAVPRSPRRQLEQHRQREGAAAHRIPAGPHRSAVVACPPAVAPPALLPPHHTTLGL